MKFFLMMSIFLFVGCGYDSGGDVVYKKKEPQPANPQWDALKPLVDAECGVCHNGTTHPKTFNSSNFGNVAVQNRIENGTMPPNKQLDSETKAKLLAYGR